MSLSVGRVDELAGDDAVGDLLRQLFRLGHGTRHALGTRRQHQLRPEGGHQQATFHAHGVGHDDDDPIATNSAHRRQADTGVAGGGFDDDGAGL